MQLLNYIRNKIFGTIRVHDDLGCMGTYAVPTIGTRRKIGTTLTQHPIWRNDSLPADTLYKAAPKYRLGRTVKHPAVASVRLFCLILIGLGLGACTKDYTERPVIRENAKRLTLSLNIPGESTSKALTTADENDLQTVHVLGFHPTTKLLLYQEEGQWETALDPANKRQFSVEVDPGEVNLVILINAGDILNASYPSGIPKTATKAEVTAGLVMELNGKWIANASDPAYLPIPFWGEIAYADIQDDVEDLTGTPVPIIRMLAKIDLEIQPDAQEKFSLQAVRLYNYNKKGQLIPSYVNTAGDEVTAPSVPAGTGVKTEGPLEYTNITMSSSSQGISMLSELYLFEAEKGSRADYMNNTCVVFGGNYNGQTAWYKVDLAHLQADGSVTYFDILRNHHYRIRILTIEGPGYPDPDEAYRSEPADFTAEILQWEIGMEEDLSEQTYYLYLPETYIYREKLWNGTTEMMLPETNHPDGWSTQISSSPTDPTASMSLPEWYTAILTDFSTIGFPSMGIGIGFQAMVENRDISGMETVHRYIHITAGNLTNVVHIEQNCYWYYFWSDMNPDIVIPAQGDGFTYNVWCKSNIDLSEDPIFTAGYYNNVNYLRSGGRGSVVFMDYTHTENGYINHYQAEKPVEIGNYSGVENTSGSNYGPAKDVISLIGKLKGKTTKSEIESPNYGGATKASQAWGNYCQAYAYGRVYWSMKEVDNGRAMTWAEAMGVNTTYNTNRMYTNYTTALVQSTAAAGRYFPNQNYWYHENIPESFKANPATGCLAYYEKADGSDKGEWFLPHGYLIWWSLRNSPTATDYYYHPNWDPAADATSSVSNWSLWKANNYTGAGSNNPAYRLFYTEAEAQQGKRIWTAMESTPYENQAHTNILVYASPNSNHVFDWFPKTQLYTARCVKRVTDEEYFYSLDTDSDYQSKL